MIFTDYFKRGCFIVLTPKEKRFYSLALFQVDEYYGTGEFGEME